MSDCSLSECGSLAGQGSDDSVSVASDLESEVEVATEASGDEVVSSGEDVPERDNDAVATDPAQLAGGALY